MTHFNNLSIEDIKGEEWRDIQGWDGFYQVSNLGRIKSFKRDYNERGIKAKMKTIIRRQSNTTHKYLKVALIIKGATYTHKVHRLVAMAFIPNPDNKPHINHKNSIKTDNRAVNLEWVTLQENNRHACDTEFARSGVQNIKSKLTTPKVKEIYLSDEYNGELAKKHNVSITCIAKIKRGETYKEVTKGLLKNQPSIV